MRWAKYVTLLFGFFIEAKAAEGKLLATPGTSSIDGSAGGGIVPWAQLSNYASDNEWGGSAFCSGAALSDYRLNVCGAQLNLFDRLELSVADQAFTVVATDTMIKQSVLGMKVRLYGDVVYSRWPQMSVGVMHKSLSDDAVAQQLGASESQGNDLYFAVSKLQLGAIAGYHWFWNVTTRYSEANQNGLLGYGGPDHSSRWHFEASSAIFLTPHMAMGYEFKEKSQNLGLGESHWRTAFLAWFPNKSMTVTAAWLNFGSIVGSKSQKGVYVSITGYF